MRLGPMTTDTQSDATRKEFARPEDGRDVAQFRFAFEPSLDGLRGIAIIVVMAFNGHLLMMRGGFIGVDLFFVLSGFLITSVLLREHGRAGRISFRNFYFRRALRLLPALFALLICVSVFASLFLPAEQAALTFKGVFYTLIYAANWIQVPPFPPGIGQLSHAWSLSVEEQFYILWPLALVGLLKLRRRALIAGVVVLLIAASMLTSIWMWATGTPHLRMYFGSDTRASEILVGCLAALIYSWGIIRTTETVRRMFRVGSVLSFAGIAVACFMTRHTGDFVYAGGFTLIAVATAVIILDFLLFPSAISRWFANRPLAWTGKISYGLYLWHVPILGLFEKTLGKKVDPAVYGTIGIGAAFVAAAISYYLIEKRFLRLKNRLSPIENGIPQVSGAELAGQS